MGSTRYRGGVVIAALCGMVAAAPPEPARTGRLEAGGGGIAGDLVPVPEVPGGVRGTFLWKSPRFAEPFEFRIDAVGGVSFSPTPAGAAQPAGAFVHLRGGDVLAGTIESLDADALVMSIAGPDGPQRLRIERGELAAISRLAGAGGGYRGPRGLDGWEQSPADAWRDEAGRVMTDKPIARLARDVGAPVRARYDLRLSRRGRTEFVVALSAPAEGKGEPPADGYSLQAICVGDEPQFMLVRRAGGKAKLEPIPHAAWRGDHLRVVLFVDQQRGRLAAVLPDAEGPDATRVTETILPPDAAEKPSGRFRLECSLGGIVLERLDVDPWLGDAPTLRGEQGTSIATRAGALEGFAVASYDAASGEYLLQRGDEQRRLAAAEFDEIRFPDDTVAAQPEPALRVVRGDGTSFAGDLLKIDERSVWLRRRGIDAAVAVPRDAIVAIRRERTGERQPEPAGRVGMLVAGEDRVRGWIAPGAAGVAGVAWRPLGCENAVTLAAGIDAEIEYVPRPPRPKGGGGLPAGQVRIFGGQMQGGVGQGLVQLGGIGGQIEMDDAGAPRIGHLVEDGAAARDGRVRVLDRIVAIAPAERKRFVATKGLDSDQVTSLLRGRVGTSVRLRVTNDEGRDPREVELARGPIGVFDGGQALEQALAVQEQLAGPDLPLDREEPFPAVIVLRSGDRAECLIEAVDGDVVVLRTPLAAHPDEAVRVPGELVKAVELLPYAPQKTIDQTLRDRLLTLPRMQRESPPTHLLRLVDADYVRGRLVKVDERSVEFDMLGNVKKFPRERVARIIWLHPEMPRQAEAAAAPPPVEPGLVAQSVAADGRRMTLVADGVEGNSLRGRSRAFGASAIDLTRADRVLLGAAVGRDVTELPFGKWTLKPAPEPRALAAPPAAPGAVQ